ncbi:MAG: hypothetical protein MUC86_13680 [Burkholderiaceae bacterium]|jgi:hypothetical protein|nr:hypothetical protein [Burkholderiaceae bacterium]
MVGDADLSDSPPVEPLLPANWPGTVVPNLSQWQAADIVLVHSSGSLKDLAISASQWASFNRATRVGCQYVHAALYVGDGEIIDSTTALGLARRSLWDYVKDHRITLRRVPNLSQTERDRIVAEAEAMRLLQLPYSRWELIWSKLVPNTLPDPEHLYCSTFIGHVVNKGAGRQLAAQTMYRPLYPATLAEHKGLDAIELEWRPTV